MGDCGWDGYFLPGWSGGDLYGAGDCGCDSLDLNLSVQDMGWYSLAAVEDSYFSGQGDGGGGEESEIFAG